MALRWTGVGVCAVLAMAALVGGIVDLTDDAARRAGGNLGLAALFGGLTVLVWRGGGWKRAFKILAAVVGCWVLTYFVLLELRRHGYL